MEITIENNVMCTKTIIKKEDIKNILLNMKTSYKKYMDNFFKENFNTTFGGLALMSYFMMLKTNLYMSNPHIWNEIVITTDEENYYIRMSLTQFYDLDLTKHNTEEIQLIYNVKMLEEEKEVLNNYIQQIPDEKQLKERFAHFADTMINVDNLIKEFKEQVKSAKENGVTIKNNLKKDILEAIFGSYVIYFYKDTMNNNKDFLEKYYGQEK